jgi:acetoin utilization deacetylase AcuC-like enzyme
MNVNQTVVVYEEDCLAHENGSMLLDPRVATWFAVPHAESPERLARAYEALVGADAIGKLERLPARLAEPEELTLAHSREHVEHVFAVCEAGDLALAGPDAWAGGASLRPALLSAGGALAAVDWVLQEPGRRGYVLTRPPGHHASRAQAMGFCLFNNVALAARRARELGVERVAIVDWDVHHGNGTEDIFLEDPSVLAISIHQDDFYPKGRGRVEDRGLGDGLGATINVPLPAGSGDETYLRTIREVVLPALTSFAPEVVLLASGQDAAAADPLGRMSVSAAGFRAMTAELADFAAAHCQGHLLAVQEGGYSVDHMPLCVLATVEALAGLEPSFEDDPLSIEQPSGPRPEELGAIARARRELEHDH